MLLSNTNNSWTLCNRLRCTNTIKYQRIPNRNFLLPSKSHIFPSYSLILNNTQSGPFFCWMEGPSLWPCQYRSWRGITWSVQLGAWQRERACCAIHIHNTEYKKRERRAAKPLTWSKRIVWYKLDKSHFYQN